MKLCTGEAGTYDDGKKSVRLHYINCPVHRIVPGGWLQCGDIIDGTGLNSMAAIGENHKVRDESLMADFSERFGGIVGYSTSAPHSNGSQFFITFSGCPWMKHKYVGIGRIIQGYQTLRMLEAEPIRNQKPVNTITVESCGRETYSS